MLWRIWIFVRTSPILQEEGGGEIILILFWETSKWSCTFLTLSLVRPFQQRNARTAVFVSFMGLAFRHLLFLAAGRLRIKLYMKYLSPSTNLHSTNDYWDTAPMNNSLGETQADDEQEKIEKEWLWEKMTGRKKGRRDDEIDGGQGSTVRERMLRRCCVGNKWRTGEEGGITKKKNLSVCPQRNGSNRITHTSKRRFCFSSKK